MLSKKSKKINIKETASYESTWIGPEGNDVGERSVALVIPGLDLDEIGCVGCEALDSSGHLVTHYALHDPVAVPLRAVRRIEYDVTYRNPQRRHS